MSSCRAPAKVAAITTRPARYGAVREALWPRAEATDSDWQRFRLGRDTCCRLSGACQGAGPLK